MSAYHETLHPTFLKETRDIEIVFPDTISIEASDKDKYTALCAGLYRDFMDKYRGKGSSSGAVSHGFRVIGKIVGQAPSAHVDFARAKRSQPDVDTLVEILSRSFSTAVKPLAGTDNESNTTMEAHLGLIGGGSSVAYRMTEDDGMVHYGPDPLAFSFALDEIEARIQRGTIEELPVTRRCLALPFVLPKLWETVVTGCAVHPQYFSADIQSLTDLRVKS